jgi:hypothetical protein
MLHFRFPLHDDDYRRKQSSKKKPLHGGMACRPAANRCEDEWKRRESKRARPGAAAVSFLYYGSFHTSIVVL